MVNTINQSFSEVYDIILHLEKELYNKIPQKFIQMIEQNRDADYEFNIDYSKNINEQKLLPDTRVILSLIYRDYLCSPEERQKLIKKDELVLKQYEKNLQEKYNTENLFKNKNTSNIKENTGFKPVSMVKYKESIIKKIINRIKSIFRINRS